VDFKTGGLNYALVPTHRPLLMSSPGARLNVSRLDEATPGLNSRHKMAACCALKSEGGDIQQKNRSRNASASRCVVFLCFCFWGKGIVFDLAARGS
jgi:hypothetical protein